MQRRTLITTGLLLAALPAAAAPSPRLSDPVRAVLSPGGATLFVSETLPVETAGGVPVIRMLLPENATDFQLLVANGVIARISSKVVAGEDTGELAREKERMEKETASLKGELAACEAKIGHATKHPEKQADFPALFVRVEQLRKRIAQLEIHPRFHSKMEGEPGSVHLYPVVCAPIADDRAHHSGHLFGQQLQAQRFLMRKSPKGSGFLRLPKRLFDSFSETVDLNDVRFHGLLLSEFMRRSDRHTKPSVRFHRC